MAKCDEPLKIAFIGGSLESAVGYTHYVSSTMDNKWEIVAGCFSRNHSKNIETARLYGVNPKYVYSNWLDMLEKAEQHIDAVAILLPTPLHFDVVMKCIELEYPVICEKALVANVLQGRALLKYQNENNAFVAVTYNYSGYPMLRELQEIIRMGSLGKIIHYSIEMPQEGFTRVGENGKAVIPQEWRLSDGRIPTIHLDLAVHLHELTHYLFKKKPFKVISMQTSKGFFNDVIDNVYVLCKHEDDVEGQWWFSKSSLGYRNGLRIRVFGSDASAEWIQAYPEELVISYADGIRQVLDRGANVKVANQDRYTRFKAGHPAGFIEAFSNLYSDIASALIEYKKTGAWTSNEVFSVDLALEGLELLDAMVESTVSNKWEEIERWGGNNIER